MGPSARRHSALLASLVPEGATRLQCEIALDAESSDEGPRWIQVAAEGEYLGHKAGPFKFDKAIFAQIVKNFRAHPSYVAGPDGLGKAHVVPFDWRHASEQPPSSIEEQHAQGWTLDLQVRTGADGKAQLWALADMLEPAKSLIDQRKIKWTSVAVWPGAVHPVSGEEVGWYLSSIALTNDPFIQGMQAIAADYHFDPYAKPRTAADVLACLRGLFGLPDLAELGEVFASLNKLKSIALGQLPAPPGADVPSMIAALRSIFNVTTMATAAEVFAEADKLLGALAEEEATAAPTQVPINAERSAQQESPMKELLEFTAARLGVAANDVTVRDALVLRLDAAEKATKSLAAILSALGVQDTDAAVQKVAGMFTSVKALEEAMPELAALYASKMTDEEAAAEKDVDEVMAERHMAKEARVAMLYTRTGNVTLERGKTREETARMLAARDAAKANFDKLYPRQTPPPAGFEHLPHMLFARGMGAGSSPHLRALTGGAGGTSTPAQPPPQLNASAAALALELDRTPGRNRVDRAKNYLLANGCKDLPYDELMERASKLAAENAQASQATG